MSTLISLGDVVTAENFVYWLNGYFEISNSDKLSKEQVQIVRDHLKLCFDKITPNRSIGYGIGNLSPEISDGIKWNIPLVAPIHPLSNPPASC